MFVASYLGTGNSELEFHYEDSTAHYSLWKPPGNYFPRDEAPPPYEEAVRTAQAEQSVALNSQLRPSPSINTVSHSSQNSRQTTALSTVQCRHEYNANGFSINHEYANVSSVPNIAVYQNCGVSEVRQEENAGGSHLNSNKNQRSEKSKSYENVVAKATCSEAAKRNVQKQKYDNVRAQSKEFRKTDKTKGTEYYKQTSKDKNYFYENTKHRTIPNLSEYQLKDSGKVKEGIRHKSRYSERSESNLRNLIALKDLKDTPVHCTLPKNLRELSMVLNSNEFCTIALDTETLTNKPTVVAKSHSNLLEKDDVIASASCSLLQDSSKNKNEEAHSFISYQYLSSQDEDDYRSECENCKSSGFTNMDDEETDVLNETMTLQRRPLEQGEEVPYYRTSLTLPTNTKKTRFV